MMLARRFVLWLGLLSRVAAVGHFLYPTGQDGNTTLTIGSVVNLTWTDTDDYNILSLGIYQSTNATIHWLIGAPPSTNPP